MTQQQFKDEVDINNIVRKYTPDQILLTAQKATYGYAEATTFTEAMQLVAKAQQEFQELPSNVRAHFHNDPSEFLDAAGDDDRRDEFVSLGILEAMEPVIEPAPNPALQAPTTPPAPALPSSPDLTQGAE